MPLARYCGGRGKRKPHKKAGIVSKVKFLPSHMGPWGGTDLRFL